MAVSPHKLTAAAALEAFGADVACGLTSAEVETRIAKYGRNELEEDGGRSILQIIREQLSATLTIVLIVAAIVSGVLGDYEDAAAILAIVVLNAALGARQEYKAERAMAALKSMGAPTARVRRDGAIVEVPSSNLVPGDIVLLEVGAFVPADVRLLESNNLRLEEAALTGESEPVEKEATITLDAETPVADRRNMAHLGSAVASGRGIGLVVATGMETELGGVASLIRGVRDERGPLQQRLNRLGRVLAGTALAIVAVIFGLGVWRGEEIKLIFLTAVSLAVAAVPEGLPAVVTIALSLGAQRMLGRKALIRRLPAVETLGSVTLICSDKTGTLTQNRMTATVGSIGGRQIDLTTPEDSLAPAVRLLLIAGTLCNDAILQNDADGKADVIGDPTESALVLAAFRHGLSKTQLEQAFPRVDEIPFDSKRKRMTTIHSTASHDVGLAVVVGSSKHIAFTKGAMDGLLDIATSVCLNGTAEPMTSERRADLIAAHAQLAGSGARVLGVGCKPLEDVFVAKPECERELTFIGMIGLIDPPRPEARAAVARCRSAGIRVVMITGDHPLTASSIAREVGIGSAPVMLTGGELDGLSELDLREGVDSVNVFARVTPEHKLRLVQAFQDRGHIVAMTGDGVNDAPALKAADIGVAMGVAGTDVSKEASDMILQDDNFATIVAAVEEGRIIFDNIRKFIRYLLSANAGELAVMLVGPLIGMPLPLLPIQILWMNLITDGLPALALGLERGEPDLMSRPPRERGQSVFAEGVGRDIALFGPFTALVSLIVGYSMWNTNNPHWQTALFTTLTFSQVALALAMRSERTSAFRDGLSNRALAVAVSMSAVLQLAVVYLDPLQSVFDTSALPIRELGICIIAGSLSFWAVEVAKGASKQEHRRW